MFIALIGPGSNIVLQIPQKNYDKWEILQPVASQWRPLTGRCCVGTGIIIITIINTIIIKCELNTTAFWPAAGLCCTGQTGGVYQLCTEIIINLTSLLFSFTTFLRHFSTLEACSKPSSSELLILTSSCLWFALYCINHYEHRHHELQCQQWQDYFLTCSALVRYRWVIYQWYNLIVTMFSKSTFRITFT